MTSPGSFFDRIDELAQRVGSGHLEGSVEVSQLYAQYQHEGLDLRHPRGGQAKYLEAPLIEGADKYMQHVADHLLDEESGPVDAMKDNMEDLSDQVGRLAPIDFNNLRRSGHPMVKDHDQVVYDRAPEQRRLTQQELDDLRRGRHR